MKGLEVPATEFPSPAVEHSDSTDQHKLSSNVSLPPERDEHSQKNTGFNSSDERTVNVRATKSSEPPKKISRVSTKHLIARHDRRVFSMALAAGFPAVLVSLILLWDGAYPARLQWTLTVVIIGFWFGFSHAVREGVVFPLQTLSNLLAALREGDFSIRARGAARDDALGEAMLEVNFLGQILREQRLGALEATALLRTVMAEIEVAIFAFDSDHKLRLVNRAGEKLLAQPAERLMGKSAADLSLADCLDAESNSTLQMSFPGGGGRWEVHREDRKSVV